MLDLTEEVTGKRELTGFSENVIFDEEITFYLRPLHEMVLNGVCDFGKEENLLLLISTLIQKYGQPSECCIPPCRQVFQTRVILQIISAALLGLPPACTVTYSLTRKVGSMENKKLAGHLAALLTIIIWGTTFISTKILLKDFQPVEILFFRFVMGFLVLCIVCPHRLKNVDIRQELTFAAAGLCGICLYYLLENIALTFTMASNVGVIISIAPFFTAILAHLFMKSEEKLRVNFLIGFVVAMVGIVLISFNGSVLELNPMGDLLAVIAAFVWACYSILTRKISSFGYPVILTTQRTFFYGILFMIPTLFFFNFKLELTRFANMTYLLNILYLGLGASALCFVTWNFAVKWLGAVKTSVYIYMVPVITVITSVLILREQVTIISGIGTVLTLIGLFLSESRLKVKGGK